jgi:hypothetical protein
MVRIKKQPSSSSAFSFILSILCILFESAFPKLNHYPYARGDCRSRDSML